MELLLIFVLLLNILSHLLYFLIKTQFDFGYLKLMLGLEVILLALHALNYLLESLPLLLQL